MPSELTPMFILLFGGYVLFGLFQATGNRTNAQTRMMVSFVDSAEKNSARITVLEDRTKVLETDLATAKQLAADREKDLIKARDELAGRNKELETKTIELRTATGRIADLDAKIDDLTGKVKVLEDHVRTGDKKHFIEIQKLTVERDQLIAEKAVLEVENRQLKTTIEDLKTKISSLENRVLTLEARNLQTVDTQSLIEKSNTYIAKRTGGVPKIDEGGDGKG